MGKVYDEDLKDDESFFGGGMGILIPLARPTKTPSGQASENHERPKTNSGENISDSE